MGHAATERPALLSPSHYYNGAVWRASIMYAAGVEGQALVTVEDSYLPPQPPGPSPLQPRLNPDTASALRDASRRGS